MTQVSTSPQIVQSPRNRTWRWPIRISSGPLTCGLLLRLSDLSYPKYAIYLILRRSSPPIMCGDNGTPTKQPPSSHPHTLISSALPYKIHSRNQFLVIPCHSFYPVSGKRRSLGKISNDCLNIDCIIYTCVCWIRKGNVVYGNGNTCKFE